MAEPLQQPQAQPAAPPVAQPVPANAPPSGGGTMPPGAAPVAPAPPHTFAQTFDQLSATGSGGGSPEPGSVAYQPPAQPSPQPLAQPQPAGGIGQPAPVAPPPQPQAPLQTGQLPPGATATPPRDIVQSMRQRGYPVPDDWNDDLLLGELGTLVDSLKDAPAPEELARYKQLAPQLYDFAQKRPEFEKWLQQQQGQQPQGVGGQLAGGAAQPQQQQPAIQAPPVDPFALQLVEMGEITRDPKGIYGSQRVELAPYVQQLNARESHVRKFRTEFEADPQGFIQKFVDPVLTEKVKPYEEKIKELEGHLTKQSQQSAAQQIEGYFKENHSRFWATDQNGQQLYGYDGQPLMTAAGTAYANAVKSLEGTVKDPLQRHNAAITLVDQVLADANPQQTPQQAAGAQVGAYPQQYAQPQPAAAPAPQQLPAQQVPPQPLQQPLQQTAAQVQQQRNANFLQRNRINQQLNGNSHLPAPGYPNVLPQGAETPPGNNSFEYLFDQEEAVRS